VLLLDGGQQFEAVPAWKLKIQHERVWHFAAYYLGNVIASVEGTISN
jgi:hypothetical protein